MTTDLHATSATKPARRKRWVIGCLTATACLILAAVVLAGIGRGLWQREPGYWIRNREFVQQASETELHGMADGAFNRVLGELSSSRGYRSVGDDTLGVRTIRLSFDEANAWLASRLDDWLVNQKRSLPAGLSDPMLTSESGRLVVAFRYKNGDVDQVFSVLMSLKFLKDGRATLSIDGVRGGRLPLPADSVLKHLPGGESSQVVAVLLGQKPFDPILPIDGSRRARIIGLEVDDRSVGLVVQAEKNVPGR